MKHLPLICLAALLLAACEETPMGPGGPPGPPPGAYSPPSAAVFREQDFAWSTAPGPDSILGALTFRSQVPYVCTGEDVILTPETAWSRRRMTILYGSPYRAAVPVDVVRSRMASAPRGDYARFARRAKCDDANHFAFAGLPDGSWFVITLAKPAGGAAGDAVAVMRRVETRGGRRAVNLD